MRKNANFIKFYNLMLKAHEDLDLPWKRMQEYVKEQYQLLKSGIRGVEISDAAITAWKEAGGGLWDI
jgi:hypothetical protein